MKCDQWQNIRYEYTDTRMPIFFPFTWLLRNHTNFHNIHFPKWKIQVWKQKTNRTRFCFGLTGTEDKKLSAKCNFVVSYIPNTNTYMIKTTKTVLRDTNNAFRILFIHDFSNWHFNKQKRTLSTLCICDNTTFSRWFSRFHIYHFHHFSVQPL